MKTRKAKKTTAKPNPSKEDLEAQSRYGGGAPARRSPDGDHTWGNGSGRGSSGHGQLEEEDELPDVRGGLGEGSRHGHTRTTGTAGGPRSGRRAGSLQRARRPFAPAGRYPFKTQRSAGR